MCTIIMTLHTICTHHTRRREPCVFASGPWIETITVPEAPKDIVACFRTPGACNWNLKIVDRIEFGYCSLCLGRMEGRDVKINFWLTYEERQWEGTQETEDVGNVWGCLGGGRRGWITSQEWLCRVGAQKKFKRKFGFIKPAHLNRIITCPRPKKDKKRIEFGFCHRCVEHRKALEKARAEDIVDAEERATTG
ncbi:hypothetical protein NEUTE2DRAFT_128634 [Neurospora tetrasperma FGSC 2509]|nr:hypothetical protein NEUTE2DRAFT_128634 [Neurospora tetrasperma FGSC 2509]